MAEHDGFFQTYAEADEDLQRPAEVAVVVATIVRPTLERALRSVFAQRFSGRIHILLGIDVAEGDPALLDAVCRHRPQNCIVQVLHPGYSTSRWHGGVHAARHGGALRSVLSYLANSRHVAYLDDDNWWGSDHLASLRESAGRGDWAYSYRWFVHPESLHPICVDNWESVGPDRGVFREKFGGFCDPNTLMIDKLACGEALPMWNEAFIQATGSASDRRFFEALRRHGRGVASERVSAYYVISPQDSVHAARLSRMGEAYDKAGAVPPSEPPVFGPSPQLVYRGPSAAAAG